MGSRRYFWNNVRSENRTLVNSALEPNVAFTRTGFLPTSFDRRATFSEESNSKLISQWQGEVRFTDGSRLSLVTSHAWAAGVHIRNSERYTLHR